MINNTLRAEFMLKGKSVPDAAKDLKMSKKTLYRKLNGESEFTRQEIRDMIEYLSLGRDRAFDIFFTQ